MNTIEGYRHIDPAKCGEIEYRTWTQNAILELDERLRPHSKRLGRGERG